MEDKYTNNNQWQDNQNVENNSTPKDDNDIFSDSNSSEGSYEWNTQQSQTNNSGEYHHSYVNGNNENASHNPNNYDDNFSSTSNSQQNDYTNYNYSQNTNDNTQTPNYYSQYGSQSPYNNYSGSPYAQQTTASKKKAKTKKQSKPVTRKFLAAAIAITILASATVGFGGGYIANNLNTSVSHSDGLNINKVTSSSNATNTSSTAGTTSDIVKKTADSVVEIATEGVVTGNFAQQYVQKGAGSGVIISDDGYIVTNYHVIEGANTITVTLRNGDSNYTAKVIGSDEDNDIALLKIDAKNLKAVTFGDSSSLAVGDYVVAIGNPLGELGGTVTDGIISALAREVTIENKQMTLLQTNAQISPGNSGGGLFNAKGELVGIVNAKDSATEVEGIAFAIPTSNVLDIIGDLKSYGYVTGKVDMGMELTDVSSNESAFYYGVNKTGCYVISVTSGSNAEKAGFKRGDLITKVNDTDISSTADVTKALKNSKVGDTVQVTVTRNGSSENISLKLSEYTPTQSNSSNKTETKQNEDNNNSKEDNNSDDSIWSQMFGW